MPKRTVILIVILTFLTALLVFLAMRNAEQPISQQPVEQENLGDVITKPSPQAVLRFEPEEITIASGEAKTVEIVLDTKGYGVDAVQLELVYDPKVLSNVRVTAPQNSLFTSGNIVPSNSDPARGRVSFWYGIAPDSAPSQGIGPVAVVSFTLNPAAIVTETVIDILDRTMVTEVSTHENILAEILPLKVMISR